MTNTTSGRANVKPFTFVNVNGQGGAPVCVYVGAYKISQPRCGGMWHLRIATADGTEWGFRQSFYTKCKAVDAAVRHREAGSTAQPKMTTAGRVGKLEKRVVELEKRIAKVGKDASMTCWHCGLRDVDVPLARWREDEYPNLPGFVRDQMDGRELPTSLLLCSKCSPKASVSQP